MTERLRVVVDGTPIPDEDARAVWERFSAHMEAHPGDVRGFAEQEGHADARVGVDEGAPTLTLTSEGSRPPAPASTGKGGEGRTGKRRARDPGEDVRDGPVRRRPPRRDEERTPGDTRRQRRSGDETPRRNDGPPPPRRRGPRPDGNAARSDGQGPRGDQRRDDPPRRRRPTDAERRPPPRGDGGRPPLDGDAPPRRPGGVIRKEEAGTPQGVTKKRGRPQVVDAEPPRRKRKKR